MVKKTDLNTKATEIEGEIPSITGLATNSELTAVENKIPDATEIANIKNEYVTNAALTARHNYLIQKTKFDNEVKKNNDKIASNSSEVLTYNNNQSKDSIDDLER